MRLELNEYLKKHSVIKAIIKIWLKYFLIMPGLLKRQIANQIHAEMIKITRDEVFAMRN
ncbi:MAG: hypothetical protein GY714_14960 [Desulfobacterales bacterium]|nr:hypothetical protein [Desulfobacterales bacterium]